MKALQNSLHRLLARSSAAAALAARLRNQANCVIGYHLGETDNSRFNGEFALIEHLASQVKEFVDVGANVGEWSEHMLKHSQSRGVLFEPSRQCVERLQERFQERNVTIRDAAVSDQVGTAQFAEEEDCGEGSSITEARNNNVALREVAVTTLDTEFSGAGERRIDFLKVDTEGYDLRVLRGATHLLSRTRFVQFEYNSHWLTVGSSLCEANHFLTRLGFKVVLVRSTGLHPLRYGLWNDYFRYSNFFAYRPAEHEVVRDLLREPI